jgi:beta-glucanase (GH16 family)
MHRLLFQAALLLIVCSPATRAEWALVWSDEFDYKGPPDPTKWTYEDGFVRNEEAQYYTRRLENARVEDGCLAIEGRREEYPNPGYREGSGHWRSRAKTASYTSASVTTSGKASWRYGRVEVRARLPQGRGVWPAIWTLGDSYRTEGWPRCGEIDIMEFVGKDPGLIHATVHFARNGGHGSSHEQHKVDAPWEDFHVYAMEWFPDRMDFFYDATRIRSFRLDDAGEGPDNPFRKPHYLILNLALGGSWGGEIDNAALPQRFLIDYVRVYRQKP